MSNSLSINKFNLFALLGLNKTLEEDRSQIIKQMNNLIWNSFLIDKLPQIISNKEMEKLRGLIERDNDGESAYKILVKLVPNLYDLIADYTDKFKSNFVRQYFSNMIKQINDNLDIGLDSSQEKVILDRLGEYKRAEELAYKGDWTELQNLFKVPYDK